MKDVGYHLLLLHTKGCMHATLLSHVYSYRAIPMFGMCSGWHTFKQTLTKHAHLLFEEPLKFIAHDKSCWYQVSVPIIRRCIYLSSNYISNYCVLQSVKS